MGADGMQDGFAHKEWRIDYVHSPATSEILLFTPYFVGFVIEFLNKKAKTGLQTAWDIIYRSEP